MGEALIRVQEVSLGFQAHVVLKEITFEVPTKGVLALLGPSGAGKSTLLRTLGRWNDLRPAFWCRGTLRLENEDLMGLPAERVQERIALLGQKARLYTSSVLDNAIAEVRQDKRLDHQGKLALAHSVLAPHGLWEELAPYMDQPVVELSIARQRMLAMARLVSGGAECLLLDEPLRDIAPEEHDELLEFIRAQSRARSVALVTHNQLVAQALSEHICLLSGHRLVERGPARDFFSAPKTALGKQYVASGNCWPTAPSTPPPATVSEPEPTWTPTTPQEAGYLPASFHWILPNRLSGMQRPGLLTDVDEDLSALRTLSIDLLVTLTEEPFDAEALARHQLPARHFPIVDMDVPEAPAAYALCRDLSAMLDEDQRLTLHCKAGLGRTGTMLACVLVYRGQSAVHAIHRVRSVSHLYIQSERQLSFIANFESYCRHQETSPEPSSNASGVIAAPQGR